jgi:hypothetical protein
MRDGQRQTLNRSSSIIRRPPLARLAGSKNITSRSITAADQSRVVSNDHNPKQRQQCDIITHFLPHKTDQKKGHYRWQQQGWQQDYGAARNKTYQPEDEQERPETAVAQPYRMHRISISIQHSTARSVDNTARCSQVLVGLEMKVVKVTCLT